MALDCCVTHLGQYWFQLAAAQGNPSGEYYLGLQYLFGLGLGADSVLAKDLLLRAAESGVREAANELGRIYNSGLGLDVDKAEAVKWYRISARAGHPGSQNALGAMYEHGETVNVDMAKAYFWYTLAAGSGNAEASHNGSRLKAELDTDELRHIGDALEQRHKQRH